MAIRAIVEASCLRTQRLKRDLGTREWNYTMYKKEPRLAAPVQVLQVENVGEGRAGRDLHFSRIVFTRVKTFHFISWSSLIWP